MSPRDLHPHPAPARSRRQRLAAGAVLATTSLLGTYLAALRPQPTYAAPPAGNQSASQAGLALASPIAAASIPTCAQADTRVTSENGLRNAILTSQDGSVICIDGTITLTGNLPTIDDTSITFVGTNPATDGIDGSGSFAILQADLRASASPSDDDTLTVSNLSLTNGRRFAGGAIHLRGSTDGLVVSNSTFTGNEALRNAGAIYAFRSNVDISESTFSANQATGAGGAVYFYRGHASLTNTTFSDNTIDGSGTGYTYARGAALFSLYADVSIERSSFIGNRSLSNVGRGGTSYGGAIAVDSCDITLTNTFLGDNHAGTSGGAISAFNADARLNFSTLYDNSAGLATAAQGIRLGFQSHLTSIASVVGGIADDTVITFDPANSSVDDTYSVATGPQVFTASTSRTAPGGSLELSALDGSSPGQGGRSPAETSVLVTAAPTTNPTRLLPQPVMDDQLGNVRPTTPGGPFWIGARQAAYAPPNPNPPGPTPIIAASAPQDVSVEPLDAAVDVSWQPPASTGSFPVTNYVVTAQPGGGSCLVPVTETTCTVRRLTNGHPYTFTVQALTGAGWGARSAPTEPVTPQRRIAQVFLDEGTRVVDGRFDRIRTGGSTIGIPEGARLTLYLRMSGQSTFQRGKAAIIVSSDGTFTWTRRIRADRGLTAFVVWESTTSNRVTWATVR